MKTTLRSALLASLLLCGSPLFAQTGVPRGISYQATITDESGVIIAPLPGAAIQYNITLRVFDSASGNTGQKWAEVFNGIPVSNGRFSVILGQGVPAPGSNNPTDLATIFNEQDRFVEISVVPTTAGGATKTFSPRQQLLASPTALRAAIAEVADLAKVAEVANGLSPGTLAPNAITNGTLTGAIFNNGSVDALKLGSGFINNTEFNYLNGVTSPLQAQLNAKASSSSPTFTGISRADRLVVDTRGVNSGGYSPGIEFGGSDTGQAITSQRTAGVNQNGIDFHTGFQKRMSIASDGRIGIATGNNQPRAMVDIRSAYSGGGVVFDKFWAYTKNGPVNETVEGTLRDLPLSLYCRGFAAVDAVISFSDARIKNISDQSNSEKDLELINKIEITDYTFIDPVDRGPGSHKKVIAQQVEEVFPQAVNQITGVVPDIFKNATCKDDWVMLVTDLKKGDKVRLITAKTEGIHEVLEVKEGRFRTAFEGGNDEVFVYGREVDDFRAVDYDAISMLNVSATQELHRRLEAKSKEIEEMKKQLAALKGQVSDLRTQDERREARLIVIENLLTRDSEPVKTLSK